MPLSRLGKYVLMHMDGVVFGTCGAAMAGYCAYDLAVHHVQEVEPSGALARAAGGRKDAYLDAYAVDVHVPEAANASQAAPGRPLRAFLRTFWGGSMLPEAALLSAASTVRKPSFADAPEADLSADVTPQPGSSLVHGNWRVLESNNSELLAEFDRSPLRGYTWLALQDAPADAPPGTQRLLLGTAAWGDKHHDASNPLYRLHRIYSKLLLCVAGWRYERQLWAAARAAQEQEAAAARAQAA